VKWSIWRIHVITWQGLKTRRSRLICSNNLLHGARHKYLGMISDVTLHVTMLDSGNEGTCSTECTSRYCPAPVVRLHGSARPRSRIQPEIQYQEVTSLDTHFHRHCLSYSSLKAFTALLSCDSEKYFTYFSPSLPFLPNFYNN
jgi:hypothetical protein